jgi:hypothetical protein
MRAFAARLRFAWLVAGLALLLTSTAQARAATDSIIGTWTTTGGVTIEVTAAPEGSGFVGTLTAHPSCTHFSSIGVNAWDIDLPVGNTYGGTAMEDLGQNLSTGDCWPEGSRAATWVVNGSSLDLTLGSTTSTWTNAQAASRDTAVRKAVSKAFKAINAANKKLNACHLCRKVAYGRLRPAANHWRIWLERLHPGTAQVGAGRIAAIKSFQYWTQVATAAANVGDASKARNATQYRHWYRVYLAKFNLARKYWNRAERLLWPS